MWLLHCCLLAQVLVSRAAYYHEPSMATFQPPEPLPKDSFFGYSITYHSKNLIVSAPRADLNGQIFSCALDEKKCARMDVMTTEPPRDDGAYWHNHSFWLGATVKASKNDLFVCAPRTTDNILKRSGSKTHFGTSGICYVKNSDTSNFQKMSQISTVDRYPKYSAAHNENLTDSFGWSIDIDENKFKMLVRVGSPALAAGRAMTYTDISGGVVPGVFKRDKEQGFNFGYSIASGNFLNAPKSDHAVAVGTPYGDDGVGMVLFYDKKKLLQQVYDPSGKVGSLFGAALCAAKIKRQTHLLVGSPAHFTDKSYHTGMVYVYTQIKGLMSNITKIEGPNKNGAFFGYAIANAGDMDHDKKDEIVIAAPYEDDGRGAVYLYSGSSLEFYGKDFKYLQRFQPVSTSPFWTLGLSLTTDKYSDNGCYDLAIGAPGDDKVAVYHCLTVITVKINTKFPDLRKRTDKTQFEFDVCLSGTYPPKPKDIHAKFEVRVKMAHPNATLTHAKSSDKFVKYEVTLDKKNNPSHCQKIQVTTSENGDYEQEIQFEITAKLLEDPVFRTDFDAASATVSTESQLTANPSVSAADCKNTTCEPKLTVGLTSHMDSTYVIGSSETESIRVVVYNGEGDTAYRPCVRVAVSSDGDVMIHRVPPQCFVKDQTATCQLQRQLKPKSSWDPHSIELGLTSLTSKDRVVNISAEVFNRCVLETPDDNKTISVKLKTDSSSVRIDSKTDQGDIVPFNSVEVKYGKLIHHTYTIANTAGTKWVNLLSDIKLYKQPYIAYKGPIQVYSGDTPRAPCKLPELPDSTASFDVVSCAIGDLKRKKTIVVVIPITVLPGALEQVLKDSNGTIETALKVHFELEEREKTVTTILIPGGGTVPIWVIIAAAAVGLLILGLIAFALYECGFLRRQNKAKLENLQKEVKRKSMMLQRQSMRLTDSARAELRNHTFRELLDAAELKEAEEGVEATELDETNLKGKMDKIKKEGKGEGAINGNSSVSNLDLRAQIEKSLQQKNPKGRKREETPLCDEKEI